MKFLMVRSPISIVEKDFIGHGRAKVDFSEYENISQVIDEINKLYPEGIGRKKNSVKRFFNLKKGDIVLVPIPNAITLGVVNGKKYFDSNEIKNKACNLISVNFFRTNEGRIVRIPRKSLTQGLESRLRLRQSNADLTEFKDEIVRIIESIKINGAYKQETHILERVAEEEDKFKHDLLVSITSGTTWLSAGGNGLEKLIKELLIIEGYTANIQSKRQTSDISDIDILARRIDRFSESNLMIQVKHHSNISSSHGLTQLIAFNDFEDVDYQKWFITTANVSEETLELALQNNIKVMIGSEFVDWLYQHIDDLSKVTKQQLGIIEIPLLLK